MLHEHTQPRVTWRLMLSTGAALMGSFQFGYNSGVINSPQNAIEDFINMTQISRTGHPFTVNEIRPIWALIVAMFPIGGIIGATMTGVFSEKFGRKRGMSVNSWFGVVAAVFMFVSFYAKSFEMILIGRFIVGFHCGLYTGLVPMYLSEISYSNVRGAFGTAHQFGVVVGVLISQILGFREIFGNTHYWHVLLGLTAFPAFIQFCLFYVCPESPRYLLLVRKDQLGAEDALIRLRGSNDVSGELDEIAEEVEERTSQVKMSIWAVLRSRNLRWPLTIAVVMQLSQQLSGVNAVVYYSSSLFQQAGLAQDAAQHATSGVGATLVVMTAVTIPLMDRVGRRPLHLTGLGGMFIMSVILTICLALEYKVPWLKVISVVFMLLFVVFFAIGPGSIPWLIVSELFTYGPRSSAMSIATFVNWIANFALSFAFPYMQAGLQAYAFLPFTALLIIFFIFLYMYFPETKNRTILSICTDMEHHDPYVTNSETTRLVK